VPAAQKTDCETIAVIGARGGVGATMVAVSLAWLATEKTRRKTVLVDLDLSCGAASLAFDVESGNGLSEALANPDRIDAMLLAVAAARVGEHLHLLSSEHALDSSPAIQPDAIEKLAKGLRQGFQRVILDVPRSDGAILRQALSQSSIVVVVTDFSIAGVRDTGRLIALTQKLVPGARRLVVGNRTGTGRKGDLTRGEIEKALGLTMASVIPEDSIAVPQALNSGKPVPASAPTSPVTAALRELGTQVDGESKAARGGLLSRLLAVGAKKGAAAKKG
jgi:pilus assembly protein CpaE